MSELYDCVKDLLTVQRGIVAKLNEKITEIEAHHRNCNISQTVGASVGTIGTIAVLAAPFTGGLSLAVGALAMGAGAATSIGTTAVDAYVSSGFLGEVNELVKSQEQAAENLKTLLSNLQGIVISFRDQTGLTEEEAWGAFLYMSYHEGKSIMKKIKKIKKCMDASKAIQFAKEMVGLQKAGRFTLVSKIKYLPAGASAKIMAALGKIGAKIGIKITTTAGLAVAKAAGRAAGAVFGSVLDIGVAIYGWNTNHPTQGDIEGARSSLEASISDLVKLLEAIKLFET